MSFIKNIFDKSGMRALAAVVALSLMPVMSNAATIAISDGDLIDPIDVSTTYTFEEQLTGNTGAISRMFTFVADPADTPLPVFAVNLTLTGRGTVVGAFMSWFDGANTIFATFEDVVLNGSTVGVGAAFTTLFTSPDALTQKLTLGWDSFTGNSIQVSTQVSAVPLPAGGLLLLTALGGLAAARRRRKAT